MDPTFPQKWIGTTINNLVYPECTTQKKRFNISFVTGDNIEGYYIIISGEYSVL